MKVNQPIRFLPESCSESFCDGPVAAFRIDYKLCKTIIGERRRTAGRNPRRDAPPGNEWANAPCRTRALPMQRLPCLPTTPHVVLLLHRESEPFPWPHKHL